MDAIAWIQQQGLLVSEIIYNGERHRVPTKSKPNKKNGWYIAFEAPIKTVVAGDWAEGKAKSIWRENGKNTFNRDLKKQFEEQIKAEKIRAATERQDAQFKAQITANKTLELAKKDVAEHPYIIKKKIKPTTIFIFDGALCIPCQDEFDKIWGLQKIYQDGGKYFSKGQRVKGLFHKIPGNDDRIFICEGFATGQTIHEITGHTIFVAFSANNLEEVAKTIRSLYPNSAIAVAADNDQFTEGNPGIKYAEQAAKIGDASLIVPQFKCLDSKPTDFNDLYILEGAQSVSEQLTESESAEKLMTPLGMHGKHCFVFNHMTGVLIEFSTYSTIEFYMLAPRSHWEQKYPGEQSDVDWEQAKTDLIQINKLIGDFDDSKVRGPGVWRDNGRTVINLGNKIMINGKVMNSSRLNSEYVYAAGKSFPVPTADISQDLSEFINLVLGVSWSDPNMGYYLLGWLVAAPIAGVLPIRPHIWLTGRSNAGKTTVIDRIIKPVLPTYALFTGATTEAGLRQKVGSAAVPLVFDEFDCTDTGSDRIQGVVELFRQSFDASGSKIIKGSQSGVATTYAINFCGLVSSIRVNLTEESDISRFTVLEIGKSDTWDSVKHLLPLVPKFRQAIWNRTISLVPQILENIEIIRELMPDEYSERQKHKFAILLSCYYSLTDTGIIKEPEELIKKALINQELDDEAENCLAALLSAQVRTPTAGLGDRETTMTVGYALKSVAGNIPDALRHHGMDLSDGYLYVSNTHNFIKRIYSQTKWKNSFSQILKRLPGAMAGNTHRFKDLTTKSTKIPFESLNI